MEGYYDWNFKHSKGGVCKIVELKMKTIGLTGDVCFDKIAIEFEQYWKPSKPKMVFSVGLFHKYICAN